ncbi:hypothetical protein [Arthrobacter sp. StoSoilB5]|uniref:hypothetical protein n=1 Tax=Arthrobacter sp. StoSoilB5 TaxID=2830992 RepID=UPI001CC379D3|nr:hypothetical protein [Arthrobacter sp. StoSoilB5]BCW46640.1 hypothetical protein StoSoilB5_38240 [Arthrobacter sp. StoSoilB5]
MMAKPRGTLDTILSALKNIGSGQPIIVAAMEAAAERGARRRSGPTGSSCHHDYTLSQEGEDMGDHVALRATMQAKYLAGSHPNAFQVGIRRLSG